MRNAPLLGCFPFFVYYRSIMLCVDAVWCTAVCTADAVASYAFMLAVLGYQEFLPKERWHLLRSSKANCVFV